MGGLKLCLPWRHPQHSQTLSPSLIFGSLAVQCIKTSLLTPPPKSGLLTAINTPIFQTWTLGILWIFSVSPPAWSCTTCLDTTRVATCDLSPCYLLTFFPELCSLSVPSRPDPTRSVVILYPHLLQPSSVCLNEVQCQFILLWLVPLVLSLISHCQTHIL